MLIGFGVGDEVQIQDGRLGAGVPDPGMRGVFLGTRCCRGETVKVFSFFVESFADAGDVRKQVRIGDMTV